MEEKKMGFKLFSWGRNLEKETVALFRKHMEEIIFAKDEFMKCAKPLDEDDYNGILQRAKQVSRHEHQADILRRQILQKLYGGAFLPVMRTHLYNLSDGLDDIVDSIQDAADMLEYLEGRKIPSAIKGRYKLMLKEAGNAVDLMSSILNGFFEGAEIMEMMRRAKNAEHNLDLLKAGVFREALVKNKKADPMTIWVVCKVATFISEVGDAVEDCCDRITVLKMIRQA